MGAFSIWHVILVMLVVLVVFGAGKLPMVMGDMAKGVKAFKRGMTDEPVDTAAKDNSKEIPHS
jgi:sec-independent protein translocase protein TatA